MDVSLGRRTLLASGSLLLTWLAYGAMLGFLAIIDVAHLEILHLAEWTGIFALFTLFVFALPIVTLLKPQWQVRHWYLLIGASLLWAVGLISLFFSKSPVSMLRSGGWLLVWGTYFSICSSSLYLLLLRLLLKQSAHDSPSSKYNPA
jgi:hypothetical protein